MTDKHVFLSYIREDKDRVDELQGALEAAGLSVWRDTMDLWPGDDWELKIREAIKAGSLVFVGCFSTALDSRDVSYQHAELSVAAEEYRKRPVGTNWLMTVRFDECTVPPVDLGGGRRLNETIQRTDLFGAGYLPNLSRLVATIVRVVQGSIPPISSHVTAATASAKRVDQDNLSYSERVRMLIREPSAVLDFDEFMAELRTEQLTQLRDRERFPISATLTSSNSEIARDWVRRLGDYEAVAADAMEPLKLIAMYGRKEHELAATQTMRALGQEGVQPTGLNLYRYVHQYPALVLTYVAGLGAHVRQNYSMFNAMVSSALVNVQNVRQPIPYIAYSGGRNVNGDADWLGTVLAVADDKPTANALPTDDEIDAIQQQKIGLRLTPLSDHIFGLLQPLFADHYIHEQDFLQGFDETEVLFDAIAADSRKQGEYWGPNGGYGRYTWRHRHTDVPPEKLMLARLEASGDGWTPLMGGLFGGDPERARTAMEDVVETAARIRGSRW
ncbi:toll/interleukin-1 receptor domain-containing protein [Agromyces laixinhei]|uniref:toll/interleukin-1 receptor domain-containing protein n=1 Tax=Agromyces laixinhei TaxID=2585717 RepID=UPI0012ED9534|nr:toll/interleukin-1 receptor domain-containing protein [Agromyces laixinhei]